MTAATDDGRIVKYQIGDVIPDVESWPTFEQLKNIEWITPVEAEQAATAPAASPRNDVDGC